MVRAINPDEFLSGYWQKKIQFLPAAADEDLPSLDPDELAWLAMQPDTEARLVFTEQTDDGTRYRLETGPLTASHLTSLPERDWTLLVQDVEKHLPDFRRYLGLVNFIPDWRIDDLMISCAATGGSVGPHVDNYDVFLVQGTGRRQWRLGKPDAVRTDTSSDGLSLVEPFDAAAEYQASIGDVLYLPPGVPHWGVADELCMTMSVGCRAPTRRELELGQERVLGKPVGGGAAEYDETFYTDVDLTADEAIPGCIAVETIRRLRKQSLLSDKLSEVELARIFGCVVTDPKAWLLPEPVRESSITARIENHGAIPVHGMARVAWIELSGRSFVYVNGVDQELASNELDVVREICAERRLSKAGWSALKSSASGKSLLGWMCSEGLFDAGHSSE